MPSTGKKLLDTGQTHTHTHADEVAGEICLLPLTHPGVPVLPQGAPGAVGSLYGVTLQAGSGSDRRAIFFCSCACFCVVEETRGEHANSTQKGTGDSPPDHCGPGESVPADNTQPQ